MDSDQDPNAVPQFFPESNEASALRGQWRSLASALRRSGLAEVTALLLDAMGPLSVLSAQLLYAAAPVLGKGAGQLAAILESDSATRAFAAQLAEPEGASGVKRGSG